MLITEFSFLLLQNKKLTQFGKFWSNFVFNFYLNVFEVKKKQSTIKLQTKVSNHVHSSLNQLKDS